MNNERSDLRQFLVPAALGLAGLALGGMAWRRFGSRDPDFFRGKSVLLTGGSRGLGLEMARILAREGARLMLAARSEAELARAAEELFGLGTDVATVAVDLSDPRQARGAVQETVEEFGTIDVLINNAGVIQVGPLDTMTPEDFENEMAIHFRGPLHTMLEAVPFMRRAGGGRIVNITSFGGLVAVPHMAPYTASKHALVGLSNAFRAELARENIRVTTVAPITMRVGSHLRARFKGNHTGEFTWFSTFAGAPLQSVASDVAARKIVEACRRGDPELLIGLPARALVLADTLAPNLVAWGMDRMNRMLPRPTGNLEGDEMREGLEIRPDAPDLAFIRRADRAAVRNHEV